MFSQFTGKHLCFLEKQLFKNIMNLTVPRNIPTCNISTSKEQSCCLNTQNKVKASKRGAAAWAWSPPPPKQNGARATQQTPHGAEHHPSPPDLHLEVHLHSSPWKWSCICFFPKDVSQGEEILVSPPCAGRPPVGGWQQECTAGLCPSVTHATCPTSMNAPQPPGWDSAKLWRAMRAVHFPQANETFPGCSSWALRGFASASLWRDSLLLQAAALTL